MIPDDADAGAEPRRRPRRRRRARGQDDDPTRTSREAGATDSSDAEAGAFLEPPPVGAPGDDAQPKAPRKRTRKRRRRSTRDGAGSTAAARGGAADEQEPPSETPPTDAGAAPDAEADAGGTAPARKRRRRTRSRRRKSDASPASEGAVPPLPDDDGGIPPLPDEADEPVGTERPARRKRSRSKSGRRARGGTSEGKRSKGKSSKAKTSKAKTSKAKADKDKRSSRDRKDKRGKRSRRDRRQRDPRAIDIVPRASSAEDPETEKVLLVNARDRDEARIALMVGGRLEEIYIESAAAERSSAGHVYRGRVQNVERGIGAAFVDLGRGLTGFLHASDLPLGEGDDPQAAVTDRIKPGDEVVVQITRDSIGRKGPALTGKISFPGRYLVLMPFAARSGISRRIPQGSERDRVRKLLRKLEVPEGMGVIVRTSSETTDLAALEADLEHLLKGWEFIKRKAAEPGQPGLLRGESDLAERSVRDIMPGDVTRIIVDKDDLAGRIHRLLRVWYPSAAAAADEAAHTSVRAVTAALDTPIGELEARRTPARRAPAEGEVEEPVADRNAPSPLPDDTGADAGPAENGQGEGRGPAEALAADEEAAYAPAASVADGDEAFDEADGPDRDADDAADDAGEVDVDLDVDVDDEDVEDVEDVEGVEGVEGVEDDDEDDEDDEDDLGDGAEDTEGVEEVEVGGDAGADDEDELADETPAERLTRLQHVARAMPEVELHTDAIPLFHKYGAETQLEDAFRRSTRLPSGGSIVIDQTEALVAVDVNSGRLTDETDPESTALVTNLEAVQETAHQLRLRDLGGLIVIDFIDMRERKSRRQVEVALRDALAGDRARIRMGRMGPFGLVVLSRQRIRQALSRVTHDPCTECSGTGRRRQISGLGLRVVREMQARVARSRGRGGLEVRAPKDVIGWIKKHRSQDVKQLKKACTGPITLETDPRLAVDGWAMKGLPPAVPDET